MKKLMLLVFLVGCMLAISACSSDTASTPDKKEGKKDADTIKIAGIFSSSGGAAPLGEPELETLKMLVEEQNKAGGIDGKKVDLIPYDDKSDQNEAVLAMKKAVTQDKVAAVIGGTISGNSLAMLPLAEQNKVPYFSVAASKQIHQDDNGKAREWVFKTPQDDKHAVEKILGYLKEKGLTKVAWLNVANSFGTGAHDEFKQIAKDFGVEAVIEDEFEATVKDAKPVLTRVKKAKPQAIIVWGTVQESSVVVKNIRELAIDLPVLASHGVASSQFLDLTGEAGNGVVLPAGKLLIAEELADSNPQKELLLKYKEQFTAKYNKPVSTFGAHAWDAFQMIVKAVEAGNTDSASIRDYVENDLGEFVGLTGVFNINKDNHNGLTADSFAMVKIVDGKWTLEDKQ
ncbi:ABC transporter substrate-binding protein [Bacillus massiliigorillae]|uniref:ABC transporter substrate-binding protein n=1 Tax=Bacillus massiliigorillae TaxID=1243664 RepID=UPI00039ADBCB|nr:ABC transporter substrate-binding protein [Bacillus massiliigorillae]